MTKVMIPIDLIKKAAEELGMIDPAQDEKVLHALDDYFLTLNDGQYSPLSGEHNNASNRTEVYHIARKHNVDPARMMAYLTDVALFDKFQQLSIHEENDMKHPFEKVLEDFEKKITQPTRSPTLEEGKQRSVYEAHLMKFLEQIGAKFEQGDDCVYVEDALVETMEGRFPEFEGMLKPFPDRHPHRTPNLAESASAGATGAGAIATTNKPMGMMVKRQPATTTTEAGSSHVGTAGMDFLRSLKSNPYFVDFHELQSTYSGYYAKVELSDGNIYDIEISVSK